MITIVRHATNLWLRIFPRWDSYFKHSAASWLLDRSACHIYKGYTETASYRSRGYLTPPQAEAVAMLVARSQSCLRDAMRVMEPIQAEELKP